MKTRAIPLLTEGNSIFLYFKFTVESLIADTNIVNRLINVGASV